MTNLLNEKQPLRFWRRLRDLTQDELAKKVGISKAMIYKYETDDEILRKASYEKIAKIAEALEIEVDDIKFF